MIPRIFDGQAVAVIAGGPSLKGFDFSKLAGLNVIAINRAYEFVPTARVLWWADVLFWRHHRERLMQHRAEFKATYDISYTDAEIAEVKKAGYHVYHFTGRDGFDPEPGNLRHGNNSSYSAIHLAAHLGARQIVIFGLDLQYGPRKETHFHGGYARDHHERTLKEMMLPFFGSLKKPLAKQGIVVLNASPQSALTIWPRVGLAEGLSCIQKFSTNARPLSALTQV